MDMSITYGEKMLFFKEKTHFFGVDLQFFPYFGHQTGLTPAQNLVRKTG